MANRMRTSRSQVVRFLDPQFTRSEFHHQSSRHRIVWMDYICHRILYPVSGKKLFRCNEKIRYHLSLDWRTLVYVCSFGIYASMPWLIGWNHWEWSNPYRRQT